MSDLIRVFVYGTLQPGEVNHRICAPYVVDAEPAIAPGGLYHLPFDYPAMTPEDPGFVHGVVLTFTDAMVLSILDQFEQHDPDTFRRIIPHASLEANQYRRAWLDIFTPQRSPLDAAWAYVMTRQQIACLNGDPVPDGRWNGEGRKGYKA